MDMIKPFTGKGDVVPWLKKVTLVAKLQKIVELASFIPLYLKGDILALYLEMSDEDQECAAINQEKLKQLPNVMTMAMSELISHARILSSKHQGGVVAVTVRKGGEGGGAKPENRVRPSQFKGQCFRCGGPHMIKDCKETQIGNEITKGLVDTGCSTSVVDSKFVPHCKEVYISAFVGVILRVELQIVCIGQEIKHRLFGESDDSSSAVVIEDPDFHARFDEQKWTVRWYSENNEPVTLKNKVSCYDKKLYGWKKEEFEKEVDRWIAEGIASWKEKIQVGISPLRAVEQTTKNKARPVLDFRELNVTVKCHTGDDVTDVCSETLWKWRQTASADEVIRHLNTFGLITKFPESLNGDVALELQLQRVGGELIFQRGNKVPEVADMLTRRELFSVCVILVGHYPIAGWLRVACSYIERRASGARWEDPVGEQSIMMIKEVIERVKLDDPVRGNWCVPSVKHGVVWCDASKIAMGVVLEINGEIAEDSG
ncbi:uncharacterized protein [Palaemon carinicauda]|uniref:uncharacterized protein n=1 Tax=Palaemon carinicauda TaxID=392227 RepID=UPI0035B654C5